MKKICVQPFGGLKPGDEVDVPDDSEVSADYFADPGSAAALRVKPAPPKTAKDGA